MQVSKVTFHRLHKFVEGDVPFTPEQVAAAGYSVAVAATPSGTQVYPVPAAVLKNLNPAAAVVVTFAQLGFVPQVGVRYTLQVFCTVDGQDSSASAPINFTNSRTPVAVDAVSVS